MSSLIAPIVADSLGNWLDTPTYVVPTGADMPGTGPRSIYVQAWSRQDREGTTRAGKPYVEAMLTVGFLGWAGVPDLERWTGKGGAIARAWSPDGVLLYPTSRKPPRSGGQLWTVVMAVRAVSTQYTAA